MTIELLLIASYSAIVATVIIDVTGIVEWIKRKLYRIRFTKGSAYIPYSLKPFDCAACMSFWITIGYGLWATEHTLLYIFIYACLATLIQLGIRKWILY